VGAWAKQLVVSLQRSVCGRGRGNDTFTFAPSNG